MVQLKKMGSFLKQNLPFFLYRESLFRKFVFSDINLYLCLVIVNVLYVNCEELTCIYLIVRCIGRIVASCAIKLDWSYILMDT